MLHRARMQQQREPYSSQPGSLLQQQLHRSMLKTVVAATTSRVSSASSSRRRLAAVRSHLFATSSAGASSSSDGSAAVAPIFTVVLTGGPCGGKTSSEVQLSATLAEAGYDVYFAPEVPSILIRGGAAYPGLAPENSQQLLAFEKGIIDLQMQVEESFLGVARSTGRPSVVVLDRGLLDIPAYLPRENWLEMLGQMGGYTEAEFAARYDLVIHLVSTAHGAEEIYEKEFNNNPARTETAQEARELDDKVFNCWSIHPHHLRLDNSGSFESKIASCGEGVLAMIDRGGSGSGHAD